MNNIKTPVILCVLVTFFMFQNYTIAQNKEKKNKLKITGGFGGTADFYNASTVDYPDFRNRRPDQLYRLNANANISFTKYFNLPFGVNITSGQRTLYNLPNIPNESFIDYIMNPLNRIYIGPKYKWAQLELGTQTPNYSKLTIGSMPMFGAGVNLTPGKFIFSFHSLIAQRAIEPNLDSNIFGTYARYMWSTKIGYGEKSGNLFAVSFVRSWDDTLSVARKPIGVDAKDGFVVAPTIQFKFLKKFLFSTEMATSVYTSNAESEDLTSDDDQLQKLFGSLYQPKYATKGGIANISSLAFKSKFFNFKLGFQYMGAGYEAMAFPFMQNDYIDYTFSPNAVLFKSKVILNGTIGLRTNNLNNNNLTTTNQIIGMGNLMWIPNQKFNLNVTYSNFGFRNKFDFDTLKVEMVTESYNVIPTYAWEKGNTKHRIMLTGAYNQVEDFNTYTGQFRKIQTTVIGANYSLSFTESPLTMSVFARNLNNDIPDFQYSSNSGTFQLGYSFFDKKLKPNVSFTYALNDREGFTTDTQMFGDIGFSLSLKNKLSFNASYRYTNYKFGSVRNGAQLTENFIRTGFKKRF